MVYGVALCWVEPPLNGDLSRRFIFIASPLSAALSVRKFFCEKKKEGKAHETELELPDLILIESIVL
jgi:hypothetical protein